MGLFYVLSEIGGNFIVLQNVAGAEVKNNIPPSPAPPPPPKKLALYILWICSSAAKIDFFFCFFLDGDV